MPCRWTPEAIERLRQLDQTDMADAEIAAALGTTPGSLRVMRIKADARAPHRMAHRAERIGRQARGVIVPADRWPDYRTLLSNKFTAREACAVLGLIPEA